MLVLVDANYRWWALQIDALESALAENNAQMRKMIESAAKTADIFSQWSNLYASKSRRSADLGSDGLDLATQTIAQTRQLLERLLASYAATALPESDASGAPVADGFIERRVTAKIISFPDRRKAAEQAGAATQEPARLHTRRRKIA
ncbi:MAG TPA: hypothetical protein VFY24_02750 [Azospira sp.]|nr:hypothetical protein [Azospira sp.]